MTDYAGHTYAENKQSGRHKKDRKKTFSPKKIYLVDYKAQKAF